MATGCVPQDGEEGEEQKEGKKRGSDLLQRCLDSPTLRAYTRSFLLVPLLSIHALQPMPTTCSLCLSHIRILRPC